MPTKTLDVQRIWANCVPFSDAHAFRNRFSFNVQIFAIASWYEKHVRSHLNYN